jgi:hypothetical protein
MADSGNNIQNAKNLLRLFVQLSLDFEPGRKFITWGEKMSYQTQKGCFIIWQAISLKEYFCENNSYLQKCKHFLCHKNRKCSEKSYEKFLQTLQMSLH